MNRLIGDGAYGCVFEPAFECQDGSPVKTKDPIVSKVFHSPEDATAELREHKKIKAIDPKGLFTVKMYKQCKVAKHAIPPAEFTKCNKRHEFYNPVFEQIIYENGGMDLFDASKHYHFESIIAASLPIFEGLVIMAKNKYVHNDIKTLNILYNADTKKTAIIDFGLGKSADSMFNPLRPSNSKYVYYPPEYEMFRHLTTRSLTTLRGLYQKVALPVHRMKHDQIQNAQDVALDYFLQCYTGFTTYHSIDDFFVNQTRDKYGIDLRPLLWHRDPTVNAINAYKKACDAAGINDANPMHVGSKLRAYFQKYVNRINTYMVGLAFIELFVLMLEQDRVRLDTADDKAAITEFMKMCVRMIDTDASMRYTPRQALAHFKVVRSLVGNIVGPKQPKTTSRTMMASIEAISHVTPPHTPPPADKGALESPSHPAKMAPCPVGKERNPTTKRCRKVKDVGAEIALKEVSEIHHVRCPPGKEADSSTGRCLKPCSPGKVRNSETKRCKKKE